MTKKSSQGFTFLEMVFIVVLIAILGVAVMPGVHFVRKQEAKKMAKELSTDLTAQRIRAMSASTSAAHYIHLVPNASGSSYCTYVAIPDDVTINQGGINNDNSSKISIIMHATLANSGVTTVSGIQFDKRGYMQTLFNTDVSKLNIDISCSDARAQIEFDGITGNYVIQSE